MPRIGVIIGSTRQGRFADQVMEWLTPFLQRRSDLSYQTLDLRDFDLPFFDERASNAYAPTQNAEGRRWQETLAGFDGFIFLVAEYNHAPTAALKNALDYAYPEWMRKPGACVGYGGVGGARAVEGLRTILVELQMAPVRHAVHIAGNDFYAAVTGQQPLGALTYLDASVNAMLDDLSWWAHALKAARGAGTPG